MKLDDNIYEIKYLKIKNVYIQIKDGKVIIKVPKRITKKELQEIIESKEKWIENALQKCKQMEQRKVQYTDEKFKEIVDKNVDELIELTGLVPNKVRIGNIKYAWGTCSINRNITINYNLIKYSENVIRYVILHELIHLMYMNHSKEFWNLVGKYMPNYKEVKKEFKL